MQVVRSRGSESHRRNALDSSHSSPEAAEAELAVFEDP